MRVPLLLFLLLSPLASGCSRDVEIREIFNFDTRGWAHDISLEAGRLYVADRQGGFLVFDRAGGFQLPVRAAPVRDVVSLAPNSGMPVLASRFEGLVLLSRSGEISAAYVNGGIANAVEIRKDLAFAAYGKGGLVVLRVREGRYRVVSTLATGGWAHDLRLSGDQAFLADWDGLRVVDIRDPQKPQITAFLPSPDRCISLAVQETGTGRRLALAEGHAGVALAELDSAGRPSLLGRHYFGLNPGGPEHPAEGGWVHSVAWAGRYVFAANWKRGLELLDAEDLRNPRAVLRLPTSGTSLGVKTQLQPDGSYLVFLADGEAGLRVFRFDP